MCSLLSCAVGYRYNDLQLLTAYRAKELCSCLFVIEQSEEYCNNWTTANPDVATFEIDWDNKMVHTESMLMWGASARFQDEKFGCVLLP